MDGWVNSLIECMTRYIGQTVTVFTTSGGLSGNGFTGVLISIDECNIRILGDIGAAPSCPVGSSCTNAMGPRGIINNNCSQTCTPIGSVTVIPVCSIVSFTHNAI